jgi:poly(A) polymerase
MEKYNISEGRELGIKLKEIEQVWMNNNFYISDEDVKKVMQS